MRLAFGCPLQAIRGHLWWEGMAVHRGQGHSADGWALLFAALCKHQGSLAGGKSWQRMEVTLLLPPAETRQPLKYKRLRRTEVSAALPLPAQQGSCLLPE